MKTQTHDWADEAAEHLMNFALDRLQENIALTLRDIRAQFEAGRVVSQPAAQPSEREAELVKAGREFSIGDEAWIYLSCHTGDRTKGKVVYLLDLPGWAMRSYVIEIDTHIDSLLEVRDSFTMWKNPDEVFDEIAAYTPAKPDAQESGS